MDSSELLELLSPEGLRLLDSLPTCDASGDDVRRHGRRACASRATPPRSSRRCSARRGCAARRRGQVRRRSRAACCSPRRASNRPRASRSPPATPAAIAAAGIGSVADLGCGIGGDALAFAGARPRRAGRRPRRGDRGRRVVQPRARGRRRASSRATPRRPTSAGVRGRLPRPGAPDGRPQRHHAALADPADWSPGLDVAFGFADRLPTGVKLGPGVDRELLPTDAECQWISVDRDVVEVGVWFGAARAAGRGPLGSGDQRLRGVRADGRRPTRTTSTRATSASTSTSPTAPSSGRA